MVSVEEEAQIRAYWTIFCSVLVFNAIPSIAFYLLRKRRLIRIRSVPIVLEFCFFSSLYAALTLSDFSEAPLLNCFYRALAEGCIIGKAWVPFLLFYRRLFLRYRDGQSNSITFYEASSSRLGLMSLRLCAFRKTFEMEARLCEIVGVFMLIGAAFVGASPDGEIETYRVCMRSASFQLATLVNVILFLISLFFGAGILEQFKIITRNGDRLGIKRVVLLNNKLMAVGVFLFVIVHGIDLIIGELPTGLLVLPYTTLLCYVVTMMGFPVFQALFFGDGFHADAIVGLDGKRNEIVYFEQYLYSPDGNTKMAEFLASEMNPESLLFIKAAKDFRVKFRDGGHSIEVASILSENNSNSVHSSFDDHASVLSVSTKASPAQQKIRKAAFKIYDDFLHPDAPNVINAEGTLISRVRLTLFPNGNHNSSMRKTSEPSVARRPTKIFPIFADSSDSYKVDHSTSKTMDENVSQDFSNSQASYIDHTLFDDLQREQVELLYMDNFQRFLEVPAYQLSWSNFVESAKELDQYDGM